MQSKGLIINNFSSDYEWLGRIAKGLWSLGEFAFRELLPFFEKIDTRNLKGTASFSNNINVGSTTKS